MKCSCCERNHKPATLFRWDIRLCADGRRKRVFRLCHSCDVELNRHMLKVMGDKRADEKAAKYAESA